MTATVATPTPVDSGPWHPEEVRSEPLDTAAAHLAELADEVEASGGQVRLTREGHPDLLLISADHLESLQETMFWYEDALERAAHGELPGEGEEGPGLDEAQLRDLYQDLLRRRASAAG